MDLTGIGSAFDFAKALVNRFLPANATESEKMEMQIKARALIEDRDRQLLDAQKSIIVAEIQSDSWLTKNWRPILMLVIVSIVANNYLIYPYLSLFFEKAPVLDLPERLFSLMELGVGGYVVGRSVENGLSIWKNGKK